MNNRIRNTLGQAAVMLIMVVALVFALKHFASTSYTTYYESNDGYIPVTFSPCEVVSVTEREITVNYNGNAYSCYVDETEIKKGDVVWAGFASYEGNLELIDIH